MFLPVGLHLRVGKVQVTMYSRQQAAGSFSVIVLPSQNSVIETLNNWFLTEVTPDSSQAASVSSRGASSGPAFDRNLP